MSDTSTADLLGKILDALSMGSYGRSEPLPSALTNAQKIQLAAAGIAAFVGARIFFGLIGLPAVPYVSSLLTADQPFYAVFAAIVVFVVLTLIAKPIVGGIRGDAPVFIAAIGLLALPTHGGDVRNALFDNNSAGVFVRMIVELALLGVAVVAGYVLLGVMSAKAADDAGELTPETSEPTVVAPLTLRSEDSFADRAQAVVSQAAVVLILMRFLGQSPAKGQAMLGLALAAFLSAWVLYKTRPVAGSIWPVAGTLLAGFVSYAWSTLHPDGIAIGDIGNGLAGSAYSLPLHYVTAGVAGTIYGYWAGRSSEAAE